jgi:hypothetical protein
VALSGVAPFWVSLVFRHSGFPGVARDRALTNHSAIFTSAGPAPGWLDNTAFAIDGDWIIRAVVDTDAPIDDSDCIFGAGGEGEGEGEATLSITSITPSSAVVGESVDVVILGSGFTDGLSARIGSEAVVDLVVDSDSALRGSSSDALAAGTYDVIVQRGADIFTFPSGFTVEEAAGDDVDAGGCSCGQGADVSVAGAVVVVGIWRRRRRQY